MDTPGSSLQPIAAGHELGPVGAYFPGAATE